MPAGTPMTTKHAPVRTNTAASDASDVSASSTSSTTALAGKDFFGAIAQKVRGRDRSRSRSRTPRPPQQSPRPAAATSTASPAAEAAMAHSRPSFGHRQASESSTASSALEHHPPAKRAGTHGSDQSDFERFSYGRHSNDWLFNGFSVKDTASRIIHRHRRSGSNEGQ